MKNHDLDNEMLVIADQQGIDDLAGIMGGERTGVSENTTNMFLEAAIFDPISVAQTGRKLNINSDARYRFERGVDSNSLNNGMDRAASLIQEICGGEISESNICGEIPKVEHNISFNLTRNANRLGVEIDAAKIEKMLNKLGIKTKKNDDILMCSIPSWRQDIHGEVDLSEEVIRLTGYDSIPVLSIRTGTRINDNVLNESYKNNLRAKRFLAQRGNNELITWSFTSSKDSNFYS